MNDRLLGALTFAVILISDQLHKWYMLEIVRIQERPPIEVSSFFNLVMVWNYGVSFGMFSSQGDMGRWILIGVSIVIGMVLVGWLWRCHDRFIATAIGMVIGGAIGNVIDRVRYGAVADFFDVHVSGYHWPAFNIADAGICVGVALLMWDAFFRQPKASAAQEKSGDEIAS